MANGIYFAFILGGNYVYEVVARPLRCGVNCFDTRTLETDKEGNKVQEFLEQANHIVAENAKLLLMIMILLEMPWFRGAMMNLSM